MVSSCLKWRKACSAARRYKYKINAQFPWFYTITEPIVYSLLAQDGGKKSWNEQLTKWWLTLPSHEKTFSFLSHFLAAVNFEVLDELC